MRGRGLTLKSFWLGGFAKHHGGDLKDESNVVVTMLSMLSMASPCLNRYTLGGVIRTYGGVPESVRGGIKGGCSSSTHN